LLRRARSGGDGDVPGPRRLEPGAPADDGTGTGSRLEAGHWHEGARHLGHAGRRYCALARLRPQGADRSRFSGAARGRPHRAGARTALRLAAWCGGVRMKILAAIHDLMFSSKVNAAAGGRPITWLKRGTKVVDEVAREQPEVELLALASPQLDAINAIREIKKGGNVTVIGHVDHTREDVISAARAAGCDQGTSTGEFARRLPELLEGI